MTAPSPLEVLVNGEPRRLAEGSTLADLVEELGFGGRRIAVAVNHEVVPRAGHVAHTLRPGDRVEILEAVGGG